MAESKPRVIKDFEKLESDIQQQIKLVYPDGFEDNLIHFYNKEGVKVTALPFETDEKYYMIRMSLEEAQDLIEQDDDYDDDGVLKDSVKEDYEDKYGDLDHIDDYLSADEEDEDNDD